jgi:hypothetical protein
MKATTAEKREPVYPSAADEKLGMSGSDGQLDKIKTDGDMESEDASTTEAEPAVVIPWKYRLTAIVLIILFGTGNTYAGFVIGPLKTRLVRELKITSA